MVDKKQETARSCIYISFLYISYYEILMKIVIDTKEDIHILRHIIQLLHAVSTSAASRQKYGSVDDSSIFNSPSSSYDSSNSLSSNSTPPVADASPLFGMFDTPSTSSSDSSSIFPSSEEPKKDDKGDFLDSLQVY